MAEMRIRKVDTVKEMDNVLDDYVTRGYRIMEQGEQSVRVKEKTYGSALAHVLIFLFFGWWTFLVMNIIYAAAKYYGAQEVIIKVAPRPEAT